MVAQVIHTQKDWQAGLVRKKLMAKIGYVLASETLQASNRMATTRVGNAAASPPQGSEGALAGGAKSGCGRQNPPLDSPQRRGFRQLDLVVFQDPFVTRSMTRPIVLPVFQAEFLLLAQCMVSK